MKRIFAAAVACLASLTGAQNVPPFTALCLSELEGGFNWEKGAWVHARYKADDKIIVQKIDHVAALKNNTTDIPYRCKSIDPELYESSPNFNLREACYVIRDVGTDTNLLFDAEKCYESYSKEGVLMDVQCPRFEFSPNGLFIKLPSRASMNLSKNPPNGYKDSLALAVGTCSKLQ